MKIFLKNTSLLLFLVFIGLSCRNIDTNNYYDPECSIEMKEFGDVEIKGSFANDLGCIFTTMYINGYYYEYYEGVQLLAAEIFRRKDKNKMVELIDKVYLQHSSIIKKSNDDFKTEDIQFAPVMISTDGQDYTITCWVLEHASMIPIHEYELVVFRIDRNGNIKQNRIKSFSHSM